jgi:hypothetical protein
MRCVCCNKKLSDYECTAKHAETGAYLDTCMKCLDGLGIPIEGREDFSSSYEESDDFLDEEGEEGAN